MNRSGFSGSWKRVTEARMMSDLLQYNTGTSPNPEILTMTWPRSSAARAELSCVSSWGGDSKGRFNPVTSRFDFRCQTLNYLKKIESFPPNRDTVYLGSGSIQLGYTKPRCNHHGFCWAQVWGWNNHDK